MLRRLFDRFRAAPPYRHGGGFQNLGVGVNDLALVDYPRAPQPSYSEARYGVRNDLATIRNASGAPVQMVPLSDLMANGHFLAGTFALAQLSEEGQGNGQG